MNKACTRCQESKPATSEFFYFRKPGKLQAQCKACHIAAAMTYEAAHPKVRVRVRPTEPGATKVCARCKVEKPATEENFCRAKTGSKWFQSYCKPCAAGVTTEWHKNDPLRLQKARRHVLKRLYGLTVEQYEAMYRAQGGVCAICSRVPSGKKDRLAVDHCHESGAVRGLLCDACNKALGGFRDNPDALRKAAEYVEHHRASAPANVIPIRK